MDIVQRNSSYILGVGSKAAERLNIFDEVYGGYSRQLLLKAGLKPGMNVLDVGCGPGNMSCWMAKEVTSSGHVCAIDNSQEQITVASANAKQNSITNIQFILGTVQDIVDYQFDLIYCRYVLLHMVDPFAALQTIIQMLKPNGIFVCEEPTISTAFCYPQSDAYLKSRKLLCELAQITGVDFDIGLKIKSLLLKAGFQLADINFVQPILKNQQEKQLMELLLHECSDHYLKHNLISIKEIQMIGDHLKELAADDSTLIASPRTTQVCAFKRGCSTR